MNTTIAEQVRQVMMRELGCERPADDARLYAHLGADSLHEVALVMELEEEFGIEIHDDDWLVLDGSVRSIIRLVERLVAEGRLAP